MSSLHLNDQVLAKLELESARDDARLFEVTIGGEQFVLEIIKVPDGQTYTHPPEAARPPTLAECGGMIGHLVSLMMAPVGSFGDRQGGRFGDRRSLLPADVSEREAGPPPDMEAGWEAYRRQAIDTLGHDFGAWANLTSEHQECFCVGVWEAVEGAGAMAADYRRMTAWKPSDDLQQHLPWVGEKSVREIISEIPTGIHSEEYILEIIAGPYSEKLRCAIVSQLNRLVGHRIGGRWFHSAIDPEGKARVFYALKEEVGHE